MKHAELPILANAIEIITEHLLNTSDKLCGSPDGRKLQHLLYELRKDKPLTSRVDHEPMVSEHLVSRSVDLTLSDDTALGHLANLRGVSRDYLIRSAVDILLDDWRTHDGA
jgi:hypothetical protein